MLLGQTLAINVVFIHYAVAFGPTSKSQIAEERKLRCYEMWTFRDEKNPWIKQK